MAHSQTLNAEVHADPALVDCRICDRFFKRRRDRSSNVVGDDSLLIIWDWEEGVVCQ